MYRIMLVIDDYNELVYLQTLLKKLSFDVEGIQNQKKYENTRLGFNPNMIIATAEGKKVNGLSIASEFRKAPNGEPKLLILKSVTQVYKQGVFDQPAIDEVLDTPVNIHKLLAALATHGGQDHDVLTEKYSKLKGMLSPDEEDELHILRFDDDGNEVEEVEKVKRQPLLNGEGPSDQVPVASRYDEPIVSSSISAEERSDRFKAYLSKMEVPKEKTAFTRDRIIAFNKSIRRADKPEDNDDLEQARKSFVKALFKK